MRISKRPVAALLLALAAVLCPAQTKTEPASQTTAAKEVKSLLRKDLLGVSKPEAAPPKRNIFAPRTGAVAPAPVVPAGDPRSASNLQAPDESGLTENAPAAPPVIVINLRYIGVIYSPRRLVALVNFEGRAIAVVEGEVIGEGIRISRVTRQEIEVSLPDSTTRTFSLEGE
jgi:Tfp pilus assembly protein PilP